MADNADYMNLIAAIVGSMGLIAVIYLLTVLARFGQKLGAVTKMRPFYYGYYGAISCVVVAVLVRFIRVSIFWAPVSAAPRILNDPGFYLVLHHLPLAVAMTISLVVTWHYWSWLLKER